MGRRVLVALGLASLALAGGGCGTLRNVAASDPAAPRVYGGVRSDVEGLVAYPIWGPLGFVTIPALLAADAVGDTVTLPYVLARQAHEWARTASPTPSPSSPQGNDTPYPQPDEANRPISN